MFLSNPSHLCIMQPVSKIVAVLARPLPTFSGSRKEDVDSFVRRIHCAFLREHECYCGADVAETVEGVASSVL
jgi:hypothetical protein